MLWQLKEATADLIKDEAISLCFHQSFFFTFFLCLRCRIVFPLLIASSLVAAWGTVQIMGRLATACNLLKFKVIFCSPMGMPFVCCTAVTNRCNLLIMCLHYALLHIKLSLIVSTLTQALDGRTSISHLPMMVFLLQKYSPGNRLLGCVFM